MILSRFARLFHSIAQPRPRREPHFQSDWKWWDADEVFHVEPVPALLPIVLEVGPAASDALDLPGIALDLQAIAFALQEQHDEAISLLAQMDQATMALPIPSKVRAVLEALIKLYAPPTVGRPYPPMPPSPVWKGREGEVGDAALSAGDPNA